MVSITASASHCFHNVECRLQAFLSDYFELDFLITPHHCQPQAPPEVIMNRLTFVPLLIAAILTTQASAESIVPLKGQTSQQTQIDINDCHSIASTSTTSTPQAGGRLKGAAVGAATLAPEPLLGVGLGWNPQPQFRLPDPDHRCPGFPDP